MRFRTLKKKLGTDWAKLSKKKIRDAELVLLLVVVAKNENFHKLL